MDSSGRWYLVAEHRRRPRTYRVSRISDVEILEAEANVADRRPLAEVWGELRTRLESQHEPVPVVLGIDPGRAEAATLRRLLGMQLAPGTGIDVEPRPDGSEIWRLLVRQPPVLAAMAVMAAPELTVLSPAWLVEEIRAGAARAVAHYSDPSPAG